MVRELALSLGLLMVFAAGVAPARAEVRPATTAAIQSQYDDKRGVAYSMSYLADGGVQLSAQSPELQFQNTSYQDGRSRLRIASHGDSVTFALSASGVELTRGNRRVTLALGASETDFDRARALIAGSRAVKRYRQLGAELEEADDDSAASHGTLIGAALVGFLDGDAGAPLRIARRLAGKKAPGLRNISMSEDCWASYADRVYAASDAFYECVAIRTWYNYDLVTWGCSFTWMLQIQGYWFQYIACSSLPLQFGD